MCFSFYSTCNGGNWNCQKIPCKGLCLVKNIQNKGLKVAPTNCCRIVCVVDFRRKKARGKGGGEMKCRVVVSPPDTTTSCNTTWETSLRQYLSCVLRNFWVKSCHRNRYFVTDHRFLSLQHLTRIQHFLGVHTRGIVATMVPLSCCSD